MIQADQCNLGDGNRALGVLCPDQGKTSSLPGVLPVLDIASAARRDAGGGEAT